MPSGNRKIYLWFVSTVVLIGCLGGPVTGAISAAPNPIPASDGPPDSIAVLGDSISAGTGTAGIPSAEQPANSWATGTNASVNSVYKRLVAINPAASGNNYNLASNGKEMGDLASQGTSLPTNTELVMIEMGGNDLCKNDVNNMTSLATYRSEFVAGLNAIEARTPNALINVSSVPDIFNLWFLRGAPNPPNSQPSSRAATARFFWDTLSVIPCQALVANPTDMSAGAIARRETVRQRDLDFNAILEEECALRLRCRFDGYATFDFSSNRPTRTSPDYLPRAEWRFVDDDISTIDHFHPSLSGHTKLAEVAWDAGRNFSDTANPTVTSASKTPAPIANGTSVVPTTVNVDYADAAGIRGIEWRTHKGATTTAWRAVNSSSFSIQVTETGTTYVETRALDVNGNMSASRIDTVNYDPAAIPAPAITGGPATFINVNSASIQFSGDGGLTFECSLDEAPYIACSSPVSLNSLSDSLHSLSVRQTAGGVNGPAATRSWTVDTAVPAAPTIASAPSGFVASKAATLSFSGEAGTTFQCSITGPTGPWSDCSSPKPYTGLAEGAAVFSVRQTDVAGNTSDPASASWTVDTVQPAAPQISGIPATPSASSSLSVSFSGELSAIFECKLDAGAFTSCTSPRQLSALSHGSHNFSVRQVDQAGNVSNYAEGNWTVDLVAPQAPVITSGPPPFTSSPTATITYTGEAGATFSCSLDETPLPTCTSPRNLTGLDEGAHSFVVKQTDQAGNSSADATRTWTVDSNALPPEITTRPPLLSASAAATFAFTGKSGASFKCSLNGGAFQACSSPVVLTGLADGVRSFSVAQTDLANNVSEPAAVTWTVDTTAPVKPVITPLANIILAVRDITINFSGEGGASIECRLDTGSWNPCTSPLSLSLLPEGQHAVEVRQTDLAGNTSPTETTAWTVDTEAPAAPVIDSSPSGLVSSTSGSVTMHGETGASFQCQITGGAWSACSSPWTLTSLPQGPISIGVRQRDAAGNTGASATTAWTVDTVPPKLTGKRVAKRKRVGLYRMVLKFSPTSGKPSVVEYSTSKKKPSAAAVPLTSKLTEWARSIKVRSRKKPTWVRVSDTAGNQSPWYRVR